jgi:hypothetical protein
MGLKTVQPATTTRFVDGEGVKVVQCEVVALCDDGNPCTAFTQRILDLPTTTDEVVRNFERIMESMPREHLFPFCDHLSFYNCPRPNGDPTWLPFPPAPPDYSPSPEGLRLQAQIYRTTLKEALLRLRSEVSLSKDTGEPELTDANEEDVTIVRERVDQLRGLAELTRYSIREDFERFCSGASWSEDGKELEMKDADYEDLFRIFEKVIILNQIEDGEAVDNGS